MRMHHKLFFGVLFLFLASYGLQAQIRFGAKAAFNIATVNYRVHPGLQPKRNPTYTIGGVMELPLPINTFLNVGLEAQTKGYRYAIVGTDTSDQVNATVTPLYIQVPVSWTFRGEEGGVYGGIGAYAAYGVAGNVKKVIHSYVDDARTETSESVVYGKKENTHFPGFDFGAVIEFGFETEMGIRISGTYSWGIGDFRSDVVKGEYIAPVNHRVGSICLSYMFASVK